MSNSPGDTSESMEYERLSRLLSGLRSLERDKRDEAVTELQNLDRETTLRVLSRILSSPDPELRCDAAEALLRIDANQTLSLVLLLLIDPDKTVRWNTCGLLHDFGDKRAIPSLVKVLLTDPEGDIRHIAAYALGEIGDSSALPALRQAVEADDGTDHEGRRIRDAATEAIENITTRR